MPCAVGPMSAADQAEVAKLAEFPPWTPGAGDGNYSIGPDYRPAPEQTAKDGVPKGKAASFTMNAADSKFYPPAGLRGRIPRKVTVYVPSQYVSGTPAPFIVALDAYGARQNQLPNVLDSMIAAHRLPAMIAVMIANGGGDGGAASGASNMTRCRERMPSSSRPRSCPAWKRSTA